METMWQERTVLLLNLRPRQRRLGMTLAKKSFNIFLTLKSVSMCLADHITLCQIYSQPMSLVRSLVALFYSARAPNDHPQPFNILKKMRL
jgi:hypothetical protein